MPEKLTRQQMLKVIEGGGSVMLDDRRIVSSIAELPTDADLAKGDSTAETNAKNALLAQRAAIDAEIAKLEKPAKAKEGAKVSETIVASGEDETEESLDEETGNLQQMTKAQLLEHAEKLNIQVTAQMNKAEIIEAIEKGGE